MIKIKHKKKLKSKKNSVGTSSANEIDLIISADDIQSPDFQNKLSSTVTALAIKNRYAPNSALYKSWKGFK